jgi:hypothetical protein
MAGINWQQHRKSYLQQAEFCDALCCRGKFKDVFKPSKRLNGEEGPRTPRVLYGGAGFGGKSYGIRTALVEILLEFRNCGFPGRSVVLACQTYDNLANRQIDKMIKEYVYSDGTPMGRLRRTSRLGLHYEFIDKTIGNILLRNLDDPNKYRGSEFDGVLVDELTENERETFDYLLYSLRSSEGLPFLPFGAGSNPDGIGHDWVRKFWVDRDFIDEVEEIRPEDFYFIQAFAQDNPSYTSAVKAAILGHSNPMIAKARWEGSWDLNVGARFSQFMRKVHSFRTQEVVEQYGNSFSFARLLRMEGVFNIYGSFDYGTSERSASAFYIHAVDNAGRVWTISELYIPGEFLNTQAEMIKNRIGDLPIKAIYCDPAMQGRGADGLSIIDRFRQHGINMIPANNERVHGWATLDEMLAFSGEGDSSANFVVTKEPRWKIHESCTNLLRQLSKAPRSSRNPEDIAEGFRDDHGLDSVRYFLHTHIRPSLGIGSTRDQLPAWLRKRMALRNSTRSNMVLGR